MPLMKKKLIRYLHISRLPIRIYIDRYSQVLHLSPGFRYASGALCLQMIIFHRSLCSYAAFGVECLVNTRVYCGMGICT